MTDEVQLKPCPFCGGEAEITTWHSLGKDGHMVDCKASAFVGGCVSDAMVQIFGETRQKTIAAWNTRPDADHTARQDRQIAALEKQLAEAREANARLQDAIDDPRKYRHRYWGAGEPDCPADIKAGNGELHTLRCKLCGSDNSMAAVCWAKLSPTCKNHPDRPTRENLDGDNLCQECCDQWVRGERPRTEDAALKGDQT